MAIAVEIRNLTKVDARAAKVTGIIRMNGNQIDKRDFTIDVLGSGTATVRWSKAAPRAGQFTVEMSVYHAQDSVASNNRATGAVSVSE